MLNNTGLPPDDPFAAVRVFADMAKAFADPAKFQERMEKLIEQETAAKAAIEQAQRDTAAALKLRGEVAKEIAEKRRQFEYEARLAADEHREKIAAEVAAVEIDRKAAADLKAKAEADTARAVADRSEAARRLRAMEGAAE